jgi:predicted RNA-binding Zn-ribbon protein involved in translation (DUF1610 family)
MMFKEKSSKKKINIDTNESYTLDAMHNNMIKSFENSNKELEYYNTLLIKYNDELNIINDKLIKNKENNYDTSELNDINKDLWNSNIELREKIIDIKGKIKELTNVDEIEYYKNTSYILFQYYETVEKQASINNVLMGTENIIKSSSELPIKQIKTIKTDTKKKKINNATKTINVLDALNNINDTKNTSNNSENVDIAKNNYDNSLNIEENNINEDKSSLVDKYMSIINKKHVRNVEEENIEMCKQCKIQMTCLQHDAIIICNNCGYQELLLVEQNRPILKQNTKDTSHFCYKRINHFREWCNQVQGKESTDIPDEIFEKILAEIKKEKILDLKKITYTKMRDILKRLRINKYYEHINYIINRINGIPTPQFSPELEEKLCSMFRSIQAPFLKHCPKDRKNFLSYSYVLYKFFQILGLNEYLRYFPLLKSREKLYVQDQIWKKICIDLNYEIIPSL